MAETRLAGRRHGRQHTPALTLAAAGLPLFALLTVSLLRLGHGYSPFGDNALIEMRVRDIGHHPVLVGIYSRYGWYHPGPALFYLLWLPYQLTRHASLSLAATATLVNLLSVVGIVAIVHRRAGRAAAAWAAVVLLVDLRVLGASAIQDYWNPTISILPFALFLISAWSVLSKGDDRWLLPLSVGVGSFVVQCHAGFALPVAAIGVLLAVRALTRARHDRSWHRPLVVTTVVVAVLWAPPVIDELTGHPGNLTALIQYARATHASWGWREGANAVLTQIGRLPAWVVGRSPVPQLYASPKLPLWPGLLGIAALAAATFAARRQTQVLWLGTIVAIAAVAAALIVERVDGPIFGYLVAWISSIGVVLWIAVGIGVLQVLTARHNAPRHDPPRLTSSLAAVAAVLAISGTWSALAAPRFGSNTSPAISHLAAAARQWVGSRPAVKMDFGIDREQLVGTWGIGTGVALQLERHGISTKVDASLRRQFGASRIVNGPWTGPRLLLGTADDPPPASERLASSGRYVLYGLSS